MTDLITIQMSCVILRRSNRQEDLYQHKHQEILVLCRFQTESEDCLQLNSSVRPGRIFANSGRATYAWQFIALLVYSRNIS